MTPLEVHNKVALVCASRVFAVFLTSAMEDISMGGMPEAFNWLLHALENPVRRKRRQSASRETILGEEPLRGATGNRRAGGKEIAAMEQETFILLSNDGRRLYLSHADKIKRKEKEASTPALDLP